MPSRTAYLLLAAGGLLTACSSAPSHTPLAATTTSSVAPATSVAPTTAATAPPTTVYAPTTPQPSPDAAAAALISDWSTGNRAAAAAVASPPSIADLFAHPYPGGYLQARGCTDPSANPGTCTYADRNSGSLFEIGVTHLPAGWYVSTVNVES